MSVFHPPVSTRNSNSPNPYPCFFSQGWRFDLLGDVKSGLLWLQEKAKGERPFAPSLSRSARGSGSHFQPPALNNLDLRTLKAGTCQEGRGTGSTFMSWRPQSKVLCGYGLPWENGPNGRIGGRGKESKTPGTDWSQVFLESLFGTSTLTFLTNNVL